MLKADSTRDSPAVQTRSSGPEWIEPDSADPGTESNDTLAFDHQEDLPTDLALDLRLHEILQQARLATSASGAVIALARGDRMVCRATLGEKAPSVGVFLNTRSGLSGACIQSREMQVCGDTLADPRVNANACQDLDIRSIVVLPVLDGGRLWGILEVFSSSPNAFGDAEIEALQSLSSRISHTVREAVEGGSSALLPDAFAERLETDSGPRKLAEHEPLLDPGQQAMGPPRPDYRTGALTVAVIALAVLLGWMVGRVGWSMAVNRAPTQIPMTPEEAQATAQVTPVVPAATSRAEEQDKPVRSAPSPQAPSRPAAKPRAEEREPIGGLVVYEHGKVVFRMAPTEKPPASESATGFIEGGSIQKAATRQADTPASPSPVPPATATGYLLKQVDPEYPEEARQQRIQGPVILNVLVGTDGSVRELEVISGDSHLIKAAGDAVRQWRFQPHLLKGKPAEFETRITVNFQLP